MEDLENVVDFDATSAADDRELVVELAAPPKGRSPCLPATGGLVRGNTVSGGVTNSGVGDADEGTWEGGEGGDRGAAEALPVTLMQV
jgi:hypothetical protein